MKNEGEVSTTLTCGTLIRDCSRCAAPRPTEQPGSRGLEPRAPSAAGGKGHTSLLCPPALREGGDASEPHLCISSPKWDGRCCWTVCSGTMEGWRGLPWGSAHQSWETSAQEGR